MKQVKKMGSFALFTFVLIAQSAVNYDGNRIAKKPGVVLTSSSVYSGGLLQQVSSPQLAGYLDQSFNGTGFYVVPLFGGATNTQIRASALQPDGKIVVAGIAEKAGANFYAAARFNTNGTLDSTFGQEGNGTVIVPQFGGGNSDEARAVRLQQDGKIVMAGLSYVPGGGPFYSAVRLNVDGTPDVTFGPNDNGTVVLDGLGVGGTDEGHALAIQPDGKLVIAGKSFDAGHNCYSAVRLLTDGSADITFGTLGNGLVIVPFFGPLVADTAYALEMQVDGKFVLAGYCCNDFDNPTAARYSAVRLNNDGSVDSSFGNNGTVVVPNFGGATNDQCLALKLQSDGKAVLAGFSNTGIANRYSAVRLDSDGLVDATFGQNGHVVLPALSEGIDDQAYGLQIQPDGSLILGGYSRNVGTVPAFTVARLLASGALDLTFGPLAQGFVRMPTFVPDGSVANTLLLQPDGKIVISGYSFQGVNRFSIARITNNPLSLQQYELLYPGQGGFY